MVGRRSFQRRRSSGRASIGSLPSVFEIPLMSDHSGGNSDDSWSGDSSWDMSDSSSSIMSSDEEEVASIENDDLDELEKAIGQFVTKEAKKERKLAAKTRRSSHREQKRLEALQAQMDRDRSMARRRARRRLTTRCRLSMREDMSEEDMDGSNKSLQSLQSLASRHSLASKHSLASHNAFSSYLNDSSMNLSCRIVRDDSCRTLTSVGSGSCGTKTTMRSSLTSKSTHRGSLTSRTSRSSRRRRSSNEDIVKIRSLSTPCPPREQLDILFGEARISKKPGFSWDAYFEAPECPPAGEPDLMSADLERAIRSKRTRQLRRLWKQGVSMNSINKFGESVVHLVCRSGNEEKLAFLLQEAKASIRVRDNTKKTPLHEVAWNHNPASFRRTLLTTILADSPELLWAPDCRGYLALDYVPKKSLWDWYDYLERKLPIVNQALEFSSWKDSSKVLNANHELLQKILKQHNFPVS